MSDAPEDLETIPRERLERAIRYTLDIHKQWTMKGPIGSYRIDITYCAICGPIPYGEEWCPTETRIRGILRGIL